MVGGQQGLEDLAVAVRQVAVDERARGTKATGDFFGQMGAHELSSLVARQKQQRVVAQLVADLGLDEILVEVGVGLGIGDDALPTPESNATFADVLDGKDPVEAVKRAFFQMGIVLQGAFDARDDRRFGAAVRAMKQGQTIGSPFAREIGDQTIDCPLHFLLPTQGILAVIPRAIEQAEACGLATRPAHLDGAKVVEDVAKVVRRRTSLPGHVLVEQADVLGVGHDAPSARESVAHLGRKLTEPTLGIEFWHHPPRDRSTSRDRRVYSQGRQGTV